jgi:hypothetical protein
MSSIRNQGPEGPFRGSGSGFDRVPDRFGSIQRYGSFVAWKELVIDCSIFKEFHEQTGKKIECKY